MNARSEELLSVRAGWLRRQRPLACAVKLRRQWVARGAAMPAPHVTRAVLRCRYYRIHVRHLQDVGLWRWLQRRAGVPCK